MSELRNSYGRLSRIICFLLAVHLFNFSIDPQDRQPDFTSEDLSINDIESITEFLAEVVFGLDNFFAEHDEADNNEGALDFSKAFFLNGCLHHAILSSYTTVVTRYLVEDSSCFSILAREISSPPPEA